MIVFLSWAFTVVIVGILIFGIFLYIFEVKNNNNGFNINSIKGINRNKKGHK